LRGARARTRQLDAGARRARIDALVDVTVRKYAPLPSLTLSYVVARLSYAIPQWRRELKSALLRARQRLAHARIDGVDWYWPGDEHPAAWLSPDAVRLLAPFDPVVWDRRRFTMLWGWTYRFEAYTPAPKRRLGYYALPLLWRDRVIGWGNVSVKDKALHADMGYAGSAAPRDVGFGRELEAELDRMRAFLKLGT
ncbi:MAG: winged helix DNA-binding domain-containing protein, partial [Burkholderiaceae bacterium]|nr:winged helix DNA-binding domain-containing protein [Burkholderiaceae bacterium]